MVAIALEGLGGLLFTVGSSLGAYLLVSKNATIACYERVNWVIGSTFRQIRRIV